MPSTGPFIQVTSRPMQGDEDFWQVHRLLVETVPITPLQFNWDIRRWEGKRFYAADPRWDPTWESSVCLWETAGGTLVGAVHGEGRGDAHLQVHPNYRQIEEEMLAWAETHLSAPAEEGDRRQLQVFVYEYDQARRLLLSQRRYQRMPYGGVARRRNFDNLSIEKPALAQGYTLRTTQPEDLIDCQRIADLLNAAFQRDFHNAWEYQNFTRLAPSFRREMDLVAVAPDGSFAAYVGIPYDEANRRGIFEPVCTHPDHRRLGLARTLMLEGLHRLSALGARQVIVDTGDMIPANRLYDSLGFTEYQKGYAWRKLF